MHPQTDDDPMALKKSFSLLDMHQWSEIIRQWDKGKETQQAYCKRLNLNIHTFSYVKAKLNRQKTTTTSFIPVTIQQDSFTSDHRNRLMFENKRGMKLTIVLPSKPQQLLHLLKIIGWHHD